MPTFRLRDDAHGEPVAHVENCFCPSMSSTGITAQPEIWEAEAASITALSEDLEADGIENGLITKAEAHKMLRLGHCIDAPPGVGRRWTHLPTDALGAWERKVETAKAPPRLISRLAFQETDRKPGRPATSHSECDHPVSKSARAACRRARAKAEK